MLDGKTHRTITVKKSWIVGVVDMEGAEAPTALLLGNHGLSMVSIVEPTHVVLQLLDL